MAKSSKGGAWERDLCKFFSKWINGTIKPYVFWRGRGSGALFTLDNNVGEAFSGDIYCIRPEGKFLTSIFSIEAKNGYPKASLDLHLKNNKNEILKDFWIQTNEGCTNGKEPLLIFNKKGFPSPWVCISENTYNKIKHLLLDLRKVQLNWPNDNLPEMYIFDFYEFFNESHITPEVIKREFKWESQ